MIQNSNAFAKKPLRAKIYSGKEFIQDLFPGIQGDEMGFPDTSRQNDEAEDNEENYDLYFPRHDSF